MTTNNDVRKHCDILDVSFYKFDNISIREVILAYKKKALKVHPDKLGEDATEEDRARATKEFQDLNNAYKFILNLVLQKTKDTEDKGAQGEEVDANDLVGDNEDERFMKDN